MLWQMPSMRDRGRLRIWLLNDMDLSSVMLLKEGARGCIFCMAILSMIYEDTTANREQLVDIIVRIFHSAIFKQTRNVFLRPIIPEGKNTQTFYDDEYFFFPHGIHGNRASHCYG